MVHQVNNNNKNVIILSHSQLFAIARAVMAFQNVSREEVNLICWMMLVQIKAAISEKPVTRFPADGIFLKDQFQRLHLLIYQEVV